MNYLFTLCGFTSERNESAKVNFINKFINCITKLKLLLLFSFLSVFFINKLPAQIMCKADFSVTNDTISLTATFNSMSSPNTLKRIWFFGDGTLDSVPNNSTVTHNYSTTGNYNVKLIIKDSTLTCTDSIIKMVKVPKVGHCGNGIKDVDEIGIDCGGIDCFPCPPPPHCTNALKDADETGVDCGGLDCVPCSGCAGISSSFSFIVDPINNKKLTFNDVSNSDTIKTKWRWSFGDATPFDTLTNPIHTYIDTGNFQVCLKVFNAKGCSSNYCNMIHVGPIGGGGGSCMPFFKFKFDSLNPKNVLFQDSSTSNSPIISRSWSFGDNTNSNLINPSHPYTNTGNYNVCLTISDSAGCSKTYCGWITVGSGGGTFPHCSNGIMDAGETGIDCGGIDCAPCGGATTCNSNFVFLIDSLNNKKVTFKSTASSDTTIIKYRWEFGDGSLPDLTQITTHTYLNAGSYNVCLRIADAKGCSTFFCQMVYVGTGVSATCNVDYTYVRDTVGNGVKFTAYPSPNITGGFWNFGDGTISNDQNPYHIFPTPGFYNVCVTANDSIGGCSFTYCNFVKAGDTTQVTGCAADFNFTVDTLTKTATFQNTSLGTITSWLWNFGDNTTANTQNATHAYTTNGFYNVCLTVFNSANNCTHTFCKPVNLTTQLAPAACLANFTFFPDTAGNNVKFMNNSLGAFTKVNWAFGDGTFSNDFNPIHQYAAPGFYNVCLSVFDSISACQNTKCMGVQVGSLTAPGACFADFTFYPGGNKVVFFNNTSQGNLTSVHWNFGDGGFSDAYSPDHQYITAGFYNVCLSIFDTATNCQKTFCKGVQVVDSSNVGYVSCFADFTFFPDSALNTVHFTNNSMGAYSKSHWAFGDGTFSNDKNPSHQYMSPGFYNVCLSIFDTASGCQNTKCMGIQVGSLTAPGGVCFADFTFYPGPNKVVYFNNTSQGNLTSVHWNFGDGGFSDLYSPDHQYNTPGFYNVCLSIFDTVTNCQKTFCKGVQVIDTTQINYVSCFADFTFFPDSASNVVLFTNNSQGGFTKSHWAFGDGTFSNDKNPSHQYMSPGFYNVCLSIFDTASGCQNTKCMGIQVGSLTAPGGVCFADFTFYPGPNKVVYFTNTSQGNLTSVHWNFGDGGFSDLYSPDHQYNTPGFYNVCLSIFDTVTNCQKTFCKGVQVIDTTQINYVSCFADFTFFPDSALNTVHYTNTSNGSYTKARWDFGDGMFSFDIEPIHQYAAPGFYHVCLTIFDSASACQNTKCMGIQVGSLTAPAACFADFTFYPGPNKVVYFNNTSQGNLTSVHWNFGDGGFSDLYSPDHQYNAPGFYQVCLSIFDTVSNCQKTFCKGVQVIDTAQVNYANCFAQFDFMPDSNNIKKVHFSNTSQGIFSKVHWNFGDGTFSGDANPIHQYPAPGYYHACLTVFDSINNCMNTFCKGVEIFNPLDTTFYGCIANFNFFPDAANGNTVHFNNNSQGNYNKVHWMFGDGLFSGANNPVHTYPQPGVYNVCLTIFDTVNYCMATFCQGVEIIDPNDTNFTFCFVDFTFYPDSTTNAIHFTNTSIGSFTNYHWVFGDGTTSPAQDPVHAYQQPGFYNVCLTVFDSASGCMNTFCHGVQIGGNAVNNLDCNSDFTFYSDSSNRTVNFQNTSTGVYTKVLWEFGDGTFSINWNPVHQYANNGYYNVCLTVFDSATHCMNTYCQVVAVGGNATVTSNCIANYIYYPQANNTVQFINNSQGIFTKLHWTFGDGSVANAIDPVHAYQGPGYYNVCLTMFDSATGCINTYCNVIQIYDSTAGNCIAAFYVYPDSGTNVVHFVDQSYGNPNDWYWDFGDNTVAGTTQDPDHTYSKAGIYEICLTINNGSCQKTFCKIVEVNGGGIDCHAEFTYYADSVTATAYFDNNSLGYTQNYMWDFGDTSLISTQTNPVHTYPGIGVYGACLTTSNDSGCVSTTCKYVNIGNDLQDKCEFSCIWPGDANNDLEANHYDLLTIGLNFAETGPMRDSVSTRWIGHFGQDWSTFQVNGVNNKHGDCNGNGAIGIEDTFAVVKNFAYSHPFQNKVRTSSPANPDLYFEVVTPNVAPGSEVEVKIMAGKDVDVTMYGVGFEVKLDTSVVDMNTAYMKFDSSWLGNAGTNLLTLDLPDPDASKGLVYGSLVRNDHVNKTSRGEIARLFFTVDSDITQTEQLEIQVTTNDGGILASGDTIAFNSGNSDTIPIIGIKENVYTSQNIKLYPNPTNGSLTIVLPDNINENKVVILDLMGQEVFNVSSKKNSKLELNMSQLSEGIYIVKVVSQNSSYQQKLQVIR